MATMTLSVPNNDISVFKLIVQRMGWIIQREAEEKPLFSSAEKAAAKQRGQQLDSFVEKFRTDEISEDDILAEVDAVRQQMYEEGRQTY